MSKNPILPLYYNDLNGSTRTWTDEEFGAYVRLLIEQWDKGFIPHEMHRLSKIADSVEKNWPVLCQKFTPGENGFLRNPVMEEIREKREKFSNHQSDNGLKGGRPKNKTQTKPKLNPNESQIETQMKPKKKPLEDENENEYEIEIEIELEKDIIMPFTSENFRLLWLDWKIYRQKELKKPYKTSQSEQAALNHLADLSGKNERQAISIIQQSIANQWQGIFEVKKQKNGDSISQQKSDAASRFLEKGNSEYASAIREANN